MRGEKSRKRKTRRSRSPKGEKRRRLFKHVHLPHQLHFPRQIAAPVSVVSAIANGKIYSRKIGNVVKIGRGDISPHLYSLLTNSQATSASAERSFSILRKLLARDRNFKDDNVRHYLMLKYNTA